MVAAKNSAETEFLRDFSGHYVSEISFLPAAEDDMRRLRVGLPDVLYVLKTGRVITSEKEEANGARWQVAGVTCHGDQIQVSLQVWCDRYCVRVLRIKTTTGESDE